MTDLTEMENSLRWHFDCHAAEPGKAGRGLAPVHLHAVDECPGELLFVAGPSPRGVFHQVLYLDGALWHDPHPSREGITEVREVLAWRPARYDHEPTEVLADDSMSLTKGQADE